MNTRDKVWQLEAAVQQLPQCEIGIKHYYADGVYLREMSAPAGAVITGKIHKHSQINVLSKGEMSVVLGDRTERVSAPFVVAAPAGSKRAFFCHTDCVWSTILGTNEKDPDKIETEMTTNSEAEYLEFMTKAIGRS